MEKSHVGMLNCWICGEGAEILLDRRLRKTLDMNMGSRPDIICSDCKSQAKNNKGIWLISVRDGEEMRYEDDIFNPYRTGGLVLIKKEALIRIFNEALDNDIKDKMIGMVEKHTYFYLEDTPWDAFGLPRGELSDGS